MADKQQDKSSWRDAPLKESGLDDSSQASEEAGRAAEGTSPARSEQETAGQ